ncbi:MAG: hypothetical protein H6698_07555 [Myxococcales bacterium]|nr:hypothetical protein [Myxococcales bacterium]MCB9534153.1 hypothetical protein [Myxococcales bacterium]
METGRLDPKVIQGIIQAMYRLFRVGAFHALDNQAIDIAIGGTLQSLRQLEQFESEGVTLIFADDTCIVNGQLLRAPPDVYDSAMDFSAFLTRTGVNSITIAKAIGDRDLRRLLALFVDKDNPAAHIDEHGFVGKHVRLRLINPNLLLGLEDERLSLLERVLLTYALAVLVIRRLFKSIESGGFDLAGYFKRMARQLATVNYTDRPAVFDVIIARHLQPDAAKLAVNSAILAVAMARRVTDHESVLSRICMSALLLDVGRHRAAALHSDPPANVAISTAILHMAMGSLRGDSVERTIVAYEAHALLANVEPGAIYADAVEPSVDAFIIATARRFIELISSGPAGDSISPDAAIDRLHAEAGHDLGHFAVDLLVDAIGIIPRGSAVELESGFRGVVVEAGPIPTQYELPTVRVLQDSRGERCTPTDVALSDRSPQSANLGSVVRVLHRPDPTLRHAQKELAGPLLAWIERRKASEAAIAARLETEISDSLEGASPEAHVAAPAAGTPPAGEPVADARRKAIGWSGETGGFDKAPTGVRRLTSRSAAASEFERRSATGAHAAIADWAGAPSGTHPTVTRGDSGQALNVAASSDFAAIPTGARPALGSGSFRSLGSGSFAAVAPQPDAFDERPITAGAAIRRRPSASGQHPVIPLETSEVSGTAPLVADVVSDGDAVHRRSIREHLEAARARTAAPPSDAELPPPRHDAATPVVAPQAVVEEPAAPAPRSMDTPAAGILRRTGAFRAPPPRPDSDEER